MPPMSTDPQQNFNWANLNIASVKLNTAGMTRHNTGKPRLSLLPYSFWEVLLRQLNPQDISTTMIEDIVAVLTFGAEKYSPNNWRKSGSWVQVGDCALRHLLAKDERDAESGFRHMAHFGCNLVFLIEFTMPPEIGVDDRHQGPEREVYDLRDIKENIILTFTAWLDKNDPTEDTLATCLIYLNNWYRENA